MEICYRLPATPIGTRSLRLEVGGIARLMRRGPQLRGMAIRRTARAQGAGFFGLARRRVLTSVRGPSTSRTTAPQNVLTSCSVIAMR